MKIGSKDSRFQKWLIGPLPGALLYAVHSGAELDLLMVRGGRRIGVEVKRADAPTPTRSMQTAREDLKLDELWIIYPGTRTFDLDEGVVVRPLSEA